MFAGGNVWWKRIWQDQLLPFHNAIGSQENLIQLADGLPLTCIFSNWQRMNLAWEKLVGRDYITEEAACSFLRYNNILGGNLSSLGAGNFCMFSIMARITVGSWSPSCATLV